MVKKKISKVKPPMKMTQEFEGEGETIFNRGNIRDVILGGQDGLVNVLGLVLGVASATSSTNIVLVAGLAGSFAESISMGAVAYTSSKAANEYYQKKVEEEKWEMEHNPEEGKKEVYDIYYKKGFRGKDLDRIVKHITSKKNVWLETMMGQELRLYPDEYSNPIRNGFVVGLASIIGSFIPLFPFFFLSVKAGILASLIISGIALFTTGAVKAKVTVGDWKKSGIEMLIVGILAAIIGYLIGGLLGGIYV